MWLPELPEHEARYIRDYVNSQSHDDEAGLVQKVGTRQHRNLMPQHQDLGVL
jgi:cytochrome c